MPHPRLAALLAAALVAGCPAALSSGTSGGSTAAIEVFPAIVGGAYRTQGGGGSLVTPYTAADVKHVAIELFTASGVTEIPVLGPDGAQLRQDVSDLGSKLVFGGLRANTTYRLKGRAYADVATASPISVEAGSFVEVPVTDDERPAIATLSIQLVDKPFAGQATGSFGMIPGGILDVGSESVSQ